MTQLSSDWKEMCGGDGLQKHSVHLLLSQIRMGQSNVNNLSYCDGVRLGDVDGGRVNAT